MAKSATVVQFTAPKAVRRKINLRTPLGKVNKQWVTVEHTEDPKQALLARVGTVPDDLVQFSKIIVAIYQPPVVSKTAGGIILTDQMQAEDLEEFYWQGKVGLIVAMGPQAYEDDESTKFHGTKNKVGDWVWFMPSNGMAVEVNEVFCRVLRERDIIGTIPHPDMIW